VSLNPLPKQIFISCYTVLVLFPEWLQQGESSRQASADVVRVTTRSIHMKKANLTLPQLSLIAGTRVVLGAGLALLYADRLSEKQRSLVGWTLFLSGVASTIPLGRMVLDRRC
jgi:hypothetical protein